MKDKNLVVTRKKVTGIELPADIESIQVIKVSELAEHWQVEEVDDDGPGQDGPGHDRNRRELGRLIAMITICIGFPFVLAWNLMFGEVDLKSYFVMMVILLAGLRYITVRKLRIKISID